MRKIIAAYREAYGGLTREVWYLSFALFINRCGSMVLAFLTLYLTEKLHFSVMQAGWIFSIYGLGSVAGSYTGGKLIRQVGAIRIQIIALILSCPCFIAVPFFESFTGVATAIFLMSFFSESVRPANNVAIIQFTEPENQTRAFGLQRMALNLGLAVGPSIGGFLSVYHFESLFYIDGLSTLLAAFLLWQFFGFKRFGRSRSSQDRQAEALDGQGTPASDKTFVLFLGLILCVSIIFFQFHATYPKYLKDHYLMTKPMIGILYAVNTVLIVVVEMVLLNEVKKLRLLPTIGWGCFLSCLGFAILPYSTMIGFAFLSMCIITFGEMLMFPLATSFVARQSSGRDVGMYMSWYAMTYSITAILAPLIGTAVYDVNRHAIWYIAGAVGFMALIGYYQLDRSKTRELAHSTP